MALMMVTRNFEEIAIGETEEYQPQVQEKEIPKTHFEKIKILLTTNILDDEFTFPNPYNLWSQETLTSRSFSVAVSSFISNLNKKNDNLLDEKEITPTKTISKTQVRFVKFMLLSYLIIVLLHAMIRGLDYENDSSLTLSAFHTFDLHSCALDAVVFFVVGRMHERPGIDSLSFILPVLLGGWFFSAMTEWSWARHNVSAHQIMCEWPTELFIFVFCGLSCIGFSVFKHVQYGWRDGILVSRFCEFGATFVVFVLPTANDPFYQFHHWFATWLVGMHLNQNYWWSRVSMALFWGVYLNGIAVYGRDSILGCKSAYYNSEQQKCLMLQEGDINSEHEWCFNPEVFNETETEAKTFFNETEQELIDEGILLLSYCEAGPAH